MSSTNEQNKDEVLDLQLRLAEEQRQRKVAQIAAASAGRIPVRYWWQNALVAVVFFFATYFGFVLSSPRFMDQAYVALFVALGAVFGATKQFYR